MDKISKTNKIHPNMIKNVYENNFREEIEKICFLIEDFPYIGMDTEFPGIVYSKDEFKQLSNYNLIKKNVDDLRVIQVGITLADQFGNFPENICTWQFNLRFDSENDLSNKESMQLLISSGINFSKHNSNGISHLEFGEMLYTSGLILNPEVYWVTFHGIYDFAYLLKVIKNVKLPDKESEFYDDLITYFGTYYDLRYLIQFTDYSKGSLQKLASECNVQRIGTQHQAGSDSLVTLMAFFKISKEICCTTPISNYKNKLFHYNEKDDVDYESNNKFMNMQQMKYYGGNMSNMNNNMMFIYNHPMYNNNLNMNGINNLNGINNMSTMSSNLNMNNIPSYMMMNYNLNNDGKDV